MTKNEKRHFANYAKLTVRVGTESAIRPPSTATNADAMRISATGWSIEAGSPKGFGVYLV